MAKAKGSRALVAVSIIVYIVCLLVLMPLNVLHRFLAPDNLPVDVVALKGTIWRGQAVVKHPMVGQVTGDWVLEPLALLSGQVKATIDVNSSQAQLSSFVSINPITQNIVLEQTNGFMSAALANKVLVDAKTQISGDFELTANTLAYNLQTGESKKADGQLVWMGGKVAYPKGRKHASADLPMLVARLGNENNELQAKVATVEGLQVASASVKKDGWAALAVRKAMIDLVGEKWPSNVSQDAVVFEVSERIFTR